MQGRYFVLHLGKFLQSSGILSKLVNFRAKTSLLEFAIQSAEAIAVQQV